MRQSLLCRTLTSCGWNRAVSWTSLPHLRPPGITGTRRAPHRVSTSGRRVSGALKSTLSDHPPSSIRGLVAKAAEPQVFRRRRRETLGGVFDLPHRNRRCLARVASRGPGFSCGGGHNRRCLAAGGWRRLWPQVSPSLCGMPCRVKRGSLSRGTHNHENPVVGARAVSALVDLSSGARFSYWTL